MLISGCQRRGKRSIAILNVPCRGSICQCPRVCWCRCRCRMAPVVRAVEVWRPHQLSLLDAAMDSAVCRLSLYLQAFFGSWGPPSSSPLVLPAPPAATQLNFPGAEHQLNSGLQLSAFSPSRVGLAASSLSFITFLLQRPAAVVLVFVPVPVHPGLGLAIFMP